MNGSYYKNNYFNGDFDSRIPNDQYNAVESELPMEQSYIENILRFNKGKKVTAYASYSDSVEWRDRKFSGIIEQAGRDHLIISDPNTGKWFLILMIYIDYVEFDEKIKYNL
ncbi:MAG: spore coat protein GerQ [Bacilli bacterium]